MARHSLLRRGSRRLERFLLGAAMTAAAFIIERRLLKAIRAGSGAAPDPPRSSGRLSVAPSDDGP